ncbi:Myotubularin-like protein [Euroglyphus maynei]|uniref:Myotubularin-like protein n=1 Tax=Euroglyphus maynei TaxID=6958 RepID=A0A1Y3AQC9_EURMA|nr:Myotubularin-like protein [Euroglyphus maynei]
MYRQSDHLVRFEFERMKFDHQSWRICDLNQDFKFSYSYPQYFIVPTDITDKDLEYVANFRYSRRIPVVVWRNHRNGCVIMRSSQPVVGWFGCRCNQDERMLQTVLKICQRDTQFRYYGTMIPAITKTNGMVVSSNGTAQLLHNGNGNLDHQAIKTANLNNGNKSMSNGGGITATKLTNIQNHSNVDVDSSNDDEDDDEDDDDNDETATTNKLLILDARSYTAAFANRAMGGGCECPEYYTNCDVQFMGLNNIHSIRKSFYSLRYICESSQIDQSK